MPIKWNTLKTAEQKAAEQLEVLAQQAREKRDQLLKETDFYMLQDAPPAPAGVTEYRQALRDITDQPGWPDNIEWPNL
ncbi:MAG: hypothetical protein CML20_10350 [Rheinheimera sp.]|uniref:phage tail assembly chaperone n=1 Tax=Arsukibacterium sp. UBA3155 TaxID=1946058 RepID=UPI000C9633DE|nr:phage tail assembly chaperone [Arsukibacterium sp. UBA3155]MAD75174.1 hypothetical protein [Rheinheimera sp.]|tara:strand:- start:19738 stop:19971 length:234 start_codon:yes stop_codon:yes gene_type:complete